MKKLIFTLVTVFGSLIFSACTDELEEIVPQENSDHILQTEGTEGENPPPRG